MRAQVPASLFGMLGLAGGWNVGARIWGLPAHLAGAIALLSSVAAWLRQPRFTAGYGSVSFGATALPTMAMRMLERGDTGAMTWAAPVLFVGVNLVIAWLGVQGRLLQAPAAPS